MRAIDADELKEQIKNGLGIKSFENLLPVEKYIVEKIDRMPTIQPEPNYEEYEWCTDCKEYDTERHCCPRWNRVIKNTVDELKSAQNLIGRHEIENEPITVEDFEKLRNKLEINIELEDKEISNIVNSKPYTQQKFLLDTKKVNN